MTMMVAAAGSAAATTPPSEPAATPPDEPNVVALSARPARLDSAIWLNTPPSPSDAAGAAAMLAGSTEASDRSAGAAWVQPCGTDMFPTRAAWPIDPLTGLPPRTAELSFVVPVVKGANAPVMAFGPARKEAAPARFGPRRMPARTTGMDHRVWQSSLGWNTRR